MEILLRYGQHPNIIQLREVSFVKGTTVTVTWLSHDYHMTLQVYDDGYKVYMVMEMMHGGELLDRILQQSYFCEKEAANIIYVLVRCPY